MKRIFIYAPDNVVEMSIALMKDLCWVAAKYAQEDYGGDEAPSNDFVKLVSLTPDNVKSFSGNSISTDLTLSSDGQLQADPPDAILLGAFWGPVDHVVEQNAAILNWLIDSHRQDIPIAAVSNAPVFLAETGLLDGKIATAYPPVAEAFRQYYPKVDLREERAITDAGNLYCANGIASGCDLIVSIIEQVYGPHIARRISKEFLIGFNRSYTLANVSFDGQKYHQDKPILLAQQLLERNYADPINVQDIAKNIGMSTRNFSRRFKTATGEAPSEYLQRVRIEAAKDLITNHQINISEVAYRVGFSDASHLGRMFMRYEHCRPTDFKFKNKTS